MVEHTTSVQVRWSDVEPAGIVYYPRFFQWYDLGCETLFLALGHGDVLAIRSWIAWVRQKTFRVEHAISVGDKPCASGFEIRAWVALPAAPGERLRAVPIPDEVARKLRGA